MNTIIEKIKAEVERLKKNEIELMENSTKKYGDYPPSSDIMLVAYQNVLSILSDLEKSEKPMNPVCAGFDGEFSKFSNDVDAEHPFPICVDEFKDFARHFYELGRQSKPMNQYEDFRGEIREWVELMVAASFPEQDNDFITEEDYRSVIKQTARHFAKWGAEHAKECEECPSRGNTHSYLKGLEDGKKEMKEQMMKEAVECEVTETCGISSVWIKTKQFKPGQKVKLIIVKED